MAATSSFYKLRIILLLTLLVISFGVIRANAQEPVDDELLQLGGRLYAENCTVCHGVNGEGRVGAALAKEWPSINPGATVRTIIANGISGSVMPAWSQAKGGPFNNSEIDAVTAYILSWQIGGFSGQFPSQVGTPRPPITPIPEVEGDPNHGAVLFDENCAVCHGVEGEGRIGANLAKNWSSIRPDLSVRAAISQGVPGSTMPAWSMVHGGPLTEHDIDDIVAFILTLPSSETDGEVEPEPEASSSPFSGVIGVLVAIVLFVIIIAIILWVQRRSSES